MSITIDRVEDRIWDAVGSPSLEQGSSGLGQSYGHFPSGSYIHTTETNTLNEDDFSLSCFFKLTSGKSAVLFDSFFSNESTQNRSNGMRLSVSAAAEVTLSFGDPMTSRLTRPLNAGEWYWIYLQRKDGITEVYLDDQRVPVISVSMDLNLSNAFWCVGGYPGVSNQETQIDYFRIRKGAVSGPEFPPMEKAQYPNIEILPNVKYVYYNAYYNHQLGQRGAGIGFKWTLLDGALPTGLTFNEDGYITGLPLVEDEMGTFPLTVLIESANGLFSAVGEIDLIYLPYGTGTDITRAWVSDTFPYGYLRGSFPTAMTGEKFDGLLTIENTSLPAGTTVEWEVVSDNLPDQLHLVVDNFVPEELRITGYPFDHQFGLHTLTFRGTEVPPPDTELTRDPKVWEHTVELSIVEYISILHFEEANASTQIEDVLHVDWVSDGNAKITRSWKALGQGSMNLPSISGAALSTGDSKTPLGDGDFTVSLVFYSTENASSRVLFTDRGDGDLTEAGLVFGLDGSNHLRLGLIDTEEEDVVWHVSENTYNANTAYVVTVYRENGLISLEVNGTPWIEEIPYSENLESKEWILGNDWTGGTGASIAIDEFRAVRGLWKPVLPLEDVEYSSVLSLTTLDAEYTTPFYLDKLFEVVVGQDTVQWEVSNVVYGDSQLVFDGAYLTGDLRAGYHKIEIKATVGTKVLRTVHEFRVWAGADYSPIARVFHNYQDTPGILQGCWYDANVIDSLYQDTMGVNATGIIDQPVSLMKDLWGNNDLTTAAGRVGFILKYDEDIQRYYLSPQGNGVPDLSRIGLTNMKGPDDRLFTAIILTRVEEPFKGLGANETMIHFGGFGSPNPNAGIAYYYGVPSEYVQAGELATEVVGQNPITVKSDNNKDFLVTVIRNDLTDRLVLRQNQLKVTRPIAVNYSLGNQICFGSEWGSSSAHMEEGERLYGAMYLPFSITDEEVLEIINHSTSSSLIGTRLRSGLEVGVYYEEQIETDLPDAVFSITAGRLPTGLSLTPEGVVSGTPTVPFERVNLTLMATGGDETYTLDLWTYTYANVLEEEFNKRALGPDMMGVWFDFSDLNSMYQDLEGLVPVTGIGDEVKLIIDKVSGNRLEQVNDLGGKWVVDYNPLRKRHFVRAMNKDNLVSHAVLSIQGLPESSVVPTSLFMSYNTILTTEGDTWLEGPLDFRTGGSHIFSMESGNKGDKRDRLKAVSSTTLNAKDYGEEVEFPLYGGVASTIATVGVEFNYASTGVRVFSENETKTVVNPNNVQTVLNGSRLDVGLHYKNSGTQTGDWYCDLYEIAILPFTSANDDEERLPLWNHFSRVGEHEDEVWTPGDMLVPPALYLDSRFGVIKDANGKVQNWLSHGTQSYNMTQEEGNKRPDYLEESNTDSGLPSISSPVGREGELGDENPWGKGYLSDVGQSWLLTVAVPYEGSRGNVLSASDGSAMGLSAEFFREDSLENSDRYISVNMRSDKGDVLGGRLAPLKTTDLPSVEVVTPILYRYDFEKGEGSGSVFFGGGENQLIGNLQNVTEGRTSVVDTGDPSNLGLRVIGHVATADEGLKDIYLVVGGSGDNVLPTGKDKNWLEGYVAHEFNLVDLLPEGHPFMANRPYLRTPEVQLNPDIGAVFFGFVAGKHLGNVGIRMNMNDAFGNPILPFLPIGNSSLEIYQNNMGRLIVNLRLGSYSNTTEVNLLDKKGNVVVSGITLLDGHFVTDLPSGTLVEGETYYMYLGGQVKLIAPSEITIFAPDGFYQPKGIEILETSMAALAPKVRYVFWPRGVKILEWDLSWLEDKFLKGGVELEEPANLEIVGGHFVWAVRELRLGKSVMGPLGGEFPINGKGLMAVRALRCTIASDIFD